MPIRVRIIALAVAAGLPLAAAASAQPATETAVLAGGCFWGMEGVFEHVKGVADVVSGYAGGSASDANYDKVSSERTGHAEAVRITSIRARSATRSSSRSTLLSPTIRRR